MRNRTVRSAISDLSKTFFRWHATSDFLIAQLVTNAEKYYSAMFSADEVFSLSLSLVHP
jgi:hypothetical protein